MEEWGQNPQVYISRNECYPLIKNNKKKHAVTIIFLSLTSGALLKLPKFRWQKKVFGQCNELAKKKQQKKRFWAQRFISK